MNPHSLPSHSSVDEDQLVRIAIADDTPKAWAPVYILCSQLITRTLALVGPGLQRADIEDLRNNLLLKLDEKLRGYEPRGYFRTWLYGVTKNFYLDWIFSAHQKRSAAAVSIDDPNCALAVLAILQDPHMTPSEWAALDDEIRMAQRCILKLKKSNARGIEALELHFFGSVSLLEIARRKCSDVGVISALIDRTLAELRAMMALGGRQGTQT